MPFIIDGITPEEIADSLISLAAIDLPLALEIRQEQREKEALNHI